MKPVAINRGTRAAGSRLHERMPGCFARANGSSPQLRVARALADGVSGPRLDSAAQPLGYRGRAGFRPSSEDSTSTSQAPAQNGGNGNRTAREQPGNNQGTTRERLQSTWLVPGLLLPFPSEVDPQRDRQLYLTGFGGRS